jgi:hypothetical protein
VRCQLMDPIRQQAQCDTSLGVAFSFTGGVRVVGKKSDALLNIAHTMLLGRKQICASDIS